MRYLLPLLLLCTSSLFAQTNYYVSTSGDNANDGLTIAGSWETLQYAMNNAPANSIVNILSGTYNEKVEVNVSGTPGGQIVFQNYQTDAVIISGSGLGGNDAIIGIFDQSYITIKGLQVANNEQLDAQGIIVEGDCKGVELRENEVYNINFSTNPSDVATETRNSQPIIVYGSNASAPVTGLIIDGNIVRDSRTGYSEGLAVNGNVDGFEVTNNEVYNVSNIGIDIIGHEGTAAANDQARNGLIADNLVYNCKSPYATAAGIYVDGGMDLIIERNVVHDGQWGIEIGCENLGKTTSGVIVRNNFIYNNDDAGLVMGGYNFPSESGKVTDSEMLNNSLYHNDQLAGGIGEVTGEIAVTYVENCRISNNIVHANPPTGLLLYVDPVNSIGLSLDYNLYYSDALAEFEYEGAFYADFAAYKAAGVQDAASAFADPKMMLPATGDLHLTTDSPARDAGDPATASAGLTDIDGEARVDNGSIDIGADEFVATLPVVYQDPFRARLVEDVVLLSWRTSTETGASSYTIEKSADAINWESIAQQVAANAGERYEVIDAKITGTELFYRLRQEDLDGSFSYSDVVMVRLPEGGVTTSIFPNPAKDWIFVRSLRQLTEMRLYGPDGQLVRSAQQAARGKLFCGDLPAGSYRLELSSRFGQTTHLVVIQ